MATILPLPFPSPWEFYQFQSLLCLSYVGSAVLCVTLDGQIIITHGFLWWMLMVVRSGFAMCTCVYYGYGDTVPETFPLPIPPFPIPQGSFINFNLCPLSTVGYGDTVPETPIWGCGGGSGTPNTLKSREGKRREGKGREGEVIFKGVWGGNSRFSDFLWCDLGVLFRMGRLGRGVHRFQGDI